MLGKRAEVEKVVSEWLEALGCKQNLFPGCGTTGTNSPSIQHFPQFKDGGGKC